MWARARPPRARALADTKCTRPIAAAVRTTPLLMASWALAGATQLIFSPPACPKCRGYDSCESDYPCHPGNSGILVYYSEDQDMLFPYYSSALS